MVSGDPLTKAFGAALLVLSAMLAVFLALAGLTLNGLAHSVSPSGVMVSEEGGMPVLSVSARISNPGPLPLEGVSVGLSVNTTRGLYLEGRSPPINMGVGENVTLSVALGLKASGGAACALLFHGDRAEIGFLLNASVGGLLPFYVGLYTNASFGALLGGLTVKIAPAGSSEGNTTYLLEYSFTNQDQYLPAMATLNVVSGQLVLASVSLEASPLQSVSGSENFAAAQLSPQNVSVVVVSALGSYQLVQLSPFTYSGEAVCA